MAGDARDRDRRRDTEEDEQRRHQKSAADAEHAGNEPDCETHGQNDKNVDRQVGDRKVDLHARFPSVRSSGTNVSPRPPVIARFRRAEKSFQGPNASTAPRPGLESDEIAGPAGGTGWCRFASPKAPPVRRPANPVELQKSVGSAGIVAMFTIAGTPETCPSAVFIVQDAGRLRPWGRRGGRRGRAQRLCPSRRRAL